MKTEGEIATHKAILPFSGRCCSIKRCSHDIKALPDPLPAFLTRNAMAKKKPKKSNAHLPSSVADKLPLSDVISHLRSELIDAQAKAEGEELRFLVEEAQIELQVGVTKGADGKVGVKFWVYSAEGGGKLEQETTQKITLKLKPEENGRAFKASGTAPRKRAAVKRGDDES
ncbi:MAG: trypco2 family protein [Planctomycetota bacterium]